MARRHIMESTFRLNLLNPQHAKINEVIKGLNPKIYKIGCFFAQLGGAYGTKSE